jgi:hypothetical protein
MLIRRQKTAAYASSPDLHRGARKRAEWRSLQTFVRSLSNPKNKAAPRIPSRDDVAITCFDGVNLVAQSRRLNFCKDRIGYLAPSRRSAGSLPQFAQIFFHENIADCVTAAPAERLHDAL